MQKCNKRITFVCIFVFKGYKYDAKVAYLDDIAN